MGSLQAVNQGFAITISRYLTMIKISYWATPDSLRLFLSPIENISEAQFLCNAYNYYSTDQSVFKFTDDGYLVIMFKLVSTGMPIQTDKFLLHITSKGKIKIMGREIKQKIDNAQI